MTDIEDKIAEKIIEKIDLETLTDKIAEKVAERIMGVSSQPTVPDIIHPDDIPDITKPWRPSRRPDFNPVVMYGCPIDYSKSPFNPIDMFTVEDETKGK